MTTQFQNPNSHPQNTIILHNRPWLIQARAAVFSLCFLGAALAMLWLGNWAKQQVPDPLDVRTVALTLPSPPPPPPPAQTLPQPTPVALTVQGTGTTLPNITLTPPAMQMAQPKPSQIKAAAPQWQNLQVDWQAFQLDELDSLPTLLTPLRVRLPKSLTRKGVNEVLVKLEILVDENGQVALIQIIDNPYPELEPHIEQMVRTSRFSPPQKGDDAVRAKFIWPVQIKG